MCIFANIDAKKTGMNIKRLRMKNGCSMRDIQRKLNLATVQAAYKWEAGTTIPGLDNLISLSVLFRVRIEDILVYTVVGGEDADKAA